MNKLYIFCGIPFSGKSYLAKKVTDKFGYTRIDLDEVKFELFDNDIKDEEIDQSGWDRVYQEMYQRIKKALEDKKTVIHDTGNFTAYERGLVRDIAIKLNLEAITVFVDTPLETTRQRLQENRKSQKRFNITDESFDSAVAEMERPKSEEEHILFKGTDNVEEWIKNNFS